MSLFYKNLKEQFFSSSHTPTNQPGSIPITYRGKSISHEEVFKYTHGRFLVDEDFQRQRRYVEFSLPELCKVASSIGKSESPVAAIEKMEGGFCKALLITRQDGVELIAKIPCLIAGPAGYTTASEVAVLQYIGKYTSLPVPKVLAWDSDSSNPVGVEYIMMEKAPGVQLYKVWSEIAGDARASIIEQIVKFEGELAAIQFPACGHLYPRSYANETMEVIPLDTKLDQTTEYCIGPSCDRMFLPLPGMTASDYDGTRGPWSSPSSYGAALVRREISRLTHGPPKSSAGFQRGTVDEQISLLKTAAKLMESLDSHPTLGQHSKPILWHNDLHLGNIFVSPESPSQITSVIDWQSTSISPMFLQVRWPVFLEPPDDYATGLDEPKLPADYDTLDPRAQELAMFRWKQANRTKMYEWGCALNNRAVADAMEFPQVFRDLFLRISETYDQGILPLRECLLDIYAEWTDLGFPGTCPLSFTKDEIKAHAKAFEEYEEFHYLQQSVRDVLGTDSEGWISPERDFEEVRELNRKFFEAYSSEQAAEKGKTREEVLRIWPFAAAL